jgi:hypothetical protein
MPTDDATPRESPRSTLAGKLVALGGVVISVAYLANLTAGGILPFEIPDVLPGVGNLDEVFFSGVLIASLAKLGINIIPGMSGNRTPRNIEGKTEPPR